MPQVDDIKSRLDIVDVVSEYIQLKPAGTSLKALCPFHTEKTPSFMVSRDRQSWHCFGCATGGDMISFVMKIENIEFYDALKILAQKAGVMLVREDPAVSSQKSIQHTMAEIAAKFWHEFLLSSPRAQKAREYITYRKISSDSLEEFSIGYAPESWDETFRFLAGKGFSVKDIFLSGYIIKSERGENYYDRFRNRIMFPIRDAHGTIVGFGGRILPGGDPKLAKYINSPQTQIYNKSKVVYNLDRAKTHMKQNDLAVIVEGYMDVIASHESGVKNVVATSGTSLTADHLKAIKRYSQNLAMAFDADEAGQNASFRGIDLVLGSEMNLRVITVPLGKDPDECARENPALWADAVKKSEPFMAYMLKAAKSRFPALSLESGNKVIEFLLPFIRKIVKPIDRDFWLREVSFYSGVPENNIRELLARASTQLKENQRAQTRDGEPKKSRNRLLEELILSIALKYPDHISYIIDHLDSNFITDPALLKLYKRLIIYYTQYITPESESGFQYKKFYNNLLADEGDGKIFQGYADQLFFLAEREFSEHDAVMLKKEMEKIIADLHKNYLRQKLNFLKVRIEEAEKEKNSELIRELSIQFSQIVDELHMLHAE